jgi:Na+-transporting NADH:ubiquinone oxidoreductase subunit C
MAEEKISFRETRLYPVIFMLIITIVFIGILAFFYNSTKDRVNKYNEIRLKSSILSTFNLSEENVEETFQKFITKVEKDNLVYYIAENNRQLLGYCFPISGAGLWGTINALLTLEPDLSRIINIEIIKHNETPGLGGRISEKWFKDQFKGKTVLSGDQVRTFELVPEDETENEFQIRQVTGATLSSKAVVDIIAREMESIKTLK